MLCCCAAVAGGTLFTDSNGREMLPRVLNTRPRWPLQVIERMWQGTTAGAAGAGVAGAAGAAAVLTDLLCPVAAILGHLASQREPHAVAAVDQRSPFTTTPPPICCQRVCFR